ncbi:putative heme iron utilization protein [Phyllobacterium sp. 1468]|uniref:HugZ family pyridoxamine 5'-phosphate oxidase n=1 Tax=Phyllobacterium sp. 1468 TaxID=2817759 RepID=UPI00285EA33A|nr:HugZ family protein [Phyllobacterium sp. 1468]MDR6634432.1 putative heme iron utilization protein [Phyllobacterium sp. 1468]
MSEKKDVLREIDDNAIRLARTLMRTARHAVIATLDPQSGAPIATRVGVSTDHDGAPIILVSALAAHTPALLADRRCSLLVGDPGKGDPLAHPRMTITARAREIARDTPEHARIAWRYLSHLPKAKLYVGLGDFRFFRLEPESAKLNGGFGQAYQLSANDWLSLSPVNDELAAAERGAVDHMNEDHADAIALYARFYAKAPNGKWRMTGIDADGFDLADGDDVLRIFFQEPLNSAKDMHMTLVRMAGEARAGLASQS